jgi:hypothetical protein
MSSVLLEVNSFAGGINRKTSPLLARIDEAYTVRNARLDKVGALRKRPGYVRAGNVPDTNPVRWLFPFYRVGASPLRQLLRISGTKFYRLDEVAGNWVDATGTIVIDATRIPDAATYANLTIIVNAAGVPLRWDGSTLANLGGSPPTGTAIAVFKDRVYIAAGNTVRFSDVANPESWPAFQTISVGLNDGDEITAIKPYFNSLLIFKRNSVWQFEVDEDNQPLLLRPLAYGIGTESWRTVWIINGVLHFASRKGIYQFAGRAPEKISYRIEDFFDKITSPENFVAWENGDMYHIFLGNVDERINLVMLYDTVLDYFSYDDPLDVRSATIFINRHDQLRQYFGDSVGNVWLLWEGYADGANADGTGGTEIEMLYESHIFQIGDPTTPIELFEVAWRMDHDLHSPATVEISADNKDWRRVAAMQEAIGKDPSIQADITRAMDIKFRIHEISRMQGASILQIVVNGNLPEVSRILPKKYQR